MNTNRKNMEGNFNERLEKLMSKKVEIISLNEGLRDKRFLEVFDVKNGSPFFLKEYLEPKISVRKN